MKILFNWYIMTVLCTLRTSVKAFTPKFSPLNTKQQKFQEFLRDPTKVIVIGVGSAGTGKTLLSCQEALGLVSLKKAQKIIITRPTVSVENEEIGFLPGNIQDKMSPWTRPIYDNLHEFYTPREIERMIQDHKIEVCPLGFMRGRTLKDTVLILDEAQNTTPNQMLMLLTRVGPCSRLFINGDLKQSDLRGLNGLDDFTGRLNTRYTENPYEMIRDGFGFVKFDDNHIIRHPIVEKVVSLYSSET